ncbi:hypothetical protein GCM10009851_19350 [Herbiconiux moechotypicola]|uniref:Uncharacterized protein n=1 Tax=Herbiconiux moechotypicola TaxID=637393 RepID=A0ABP5QJ30_9MICO
MRGGGVRGPGGRDDDRGDHEGCGDEGEEGDEEEREVAAERTAETTVEHSVSLRQVPRTMLPSSRGWG